MKYLCYIQRCHVNKPLRIEKETKVRFTFLALKQKLLKHTLPMHTHLTRHLTRLYLWGTRQHAPDIFLCPGPEMYQGCLTGSFSNKTGEQRGRVADSRTACHGPGSLSHVESEPLQRDVASCRVFSGVEPDCHRAASLNYEPTPWSLSISCTNLPQNEPKPANQRLYQDLSD